MKLLTEHNGTTLRFKDYFRDHPDSNVKDRPTQVYLQLKKSRDNAIVAFKLTYDLVARMTLRRCLFGGRRHFALPTIQQVQGIIAHENEV